MRSYYFTVQPFSNLLYKCGKESLGDSEMVVHQVHPRLIDYFIVKGVEVLHCVAYIMFRIRISIENRQNSHETIVK